MRGSKGSEHHTRMPDRKSLNNSAVPNDENGFDWRQVNQKYEDNNL